MPPQERLCSQRKPRALAIKWVEQDMKIMVEWFCRRDAEGTAYNYEAWTTSNHQEQAERMLNETGLVNKPEVDRKKAADKLETIVKDFK